MKPVEQPSYHSIVKSGKNLIFFEKKDKTIISVENLEFL